MYLGPDAAPKESSPMTLWNLVTKMWGHSQWNELVERVARQCVPEVWTQIPGSARELPPAQRYGYLRARATRSVQRAVAREFTGDSSQRGRAETEVLQRVVDLLLLYVRDQRRISTPVARAA
jgi:hypothetical protein